VAAPCKGLRELLAAGLSGPPTVHVVHCVHQVHPINKPNVLNHTATAPPTADLRSPARLSVLPFVVHNR